MGLYDDLILATAGLVNYWPLDARDGNDLGPEGSDWYDAGGDPRWRAQDGYLYLPPGAWVTCGDHLHADGRYDEWTLEAWLRPASAPPPPEDTLAHFEWLSKDSNEAVRDPGDTRVEGYYALWGYDTDPEVDTWSGFGMHWAKPPHAHHVTGPNVGGEDRSPPNGYPVGAWRYVAVVVNKDGGLTAGYGYNTPPSPMATIYGSDGTTDKSYGRGVPASDTLLENEGGNPAYLGTHPLGGGAPSPTDLAVARLAFYERALTDEEIAARVAITPDEPEPEPSPRPRRTNRTPMSGLRKIGSQRARAENTVTAANEGAAEAICQFGTVKPGYWYQWQWRADVKVSGGGTLHLLVDTSDNYGSDYAFTTTSATYVPLHNTNGYDGTGDVDEDFDLILKAWVSGGTDPVGTIRYLHAIAYVLDY